MFYEKVTFPNANAIMRKGSVNAGIAHTGFLIPEQHENLFHRVQGRLLPAPALGV